MARIEILRWEGHHEVSQSRRVKGALPWVAVPTRQGRGYCRLTREHGLAGLGAWMALLELAATRKIDNRGAIEGTIEDAALMARVETAELEAVMPTLVAIGWVRYVEDPQTSSNGAEPTTPRAPSERPPSATGPSAVVGRATERDGTGRDGTERREEEPHGSPGADAPKPSRARRKLSPRESTSRALAKALGASVAASSKQVAALIEAGHELPDISEGIKAHAEPGLAPWDWTKAFLGQRRTPPPDAYGGSAKTEPCTGCQTDSTALTPDGLCMKCAAGGSS